MIDAAVVEAESMSVPVTVVVVDESGITKEMLRMDGAPLISVQTAINKAYAAAAIGMPPDDFYAAIESDNAAVTEFGTRPGLALIAGGPVTAMVARECGFLDGLPPFLGADAIKQAKDGHVHALQIGKQVCDVAAQGDRPVGPSLSDVLGTPTVPDATNTKPGRGGAFDTLSGNALTR